MVSIAAFQAADPGSTPGQRTFFSKFCTTIRSSDVSVKFLIHGSNLNKKMLLTFVCMKSPSHI